MYDRGAVQNHDYTSIYFLLRSPVSILFYVSVCELVCFVCVPVFLTEEQKKKTEGILLRKMRFKDI